MMHAKRKYSFLWIISALVSSNWSQITFFILANLLTSISSRFSPNFDQINISATGSYFLSPTLHDPNFHSAKLCITQPMMFINRAAIGRGGSRFTRCFFFFVSDVTRPNRHSAKLCITQPMMFICQKLLKP